MSVQPLPVCGTVYGVVMNDKRSVARLGDAAMQAPYKGAPNAPVMYIKPANTLAGDGAVVHLPPTENAVEIGATVGIVIGAPAARLNPEDAMATVAGYLLVADLSLPHASYYRPAIREKCFDTSCPMAANIIASQNIGDFTQVTLRTFIDGALAGERSMADLLRQVPRLLSDVTGFMTLHVGDVLLVGVEYLAPQAPVGATVRIEGDGLGQLGFRIASPREN